MSGQLSNGCDSFCSLSGFQQKEHGHHHHGHMMMPGQPASNLVMIHSGCCFGILEGTFNKKSLPLHVGEPFRSGFCRGIGEAVFDGFRGVNLSPDHKVPLADGLFLVKPNPDSLREDINLQPDLWWSHG